MMSTRKKELPAMQTNEDEADESGPNTGNDSRQLLYTEIPQCYCLVKHQWILHKRRSKCGARMCTMNAAGGDKELFYLRLILPCRREATGNHYYDLYSYYAKKLFAIIHFSARLF
jgi:hypothetical protein